MPASSPPVHLCASAFLKVGFFTDIIKPSGDVDHARYRARRCLFHDCRTVIFNRLD